MRNERIRHSKIVIFLLASCERMYYYSVTEQAYVRVRGDGGGMEVETSVARAVRTTDAMARYDAACKRVLSERQVLAYIMHDFMWEYAGCGRDQIVSEFLEGDPLVGSDPVERDADGPVRLGESQDVTLYENDVFFDVRFDALLPGGRGEAHIEVDLEAQNKMPSEYPLLKRAVYYCGRMLSRQGGAHVRRSRYDRVRKVVSIWVCMDAGVGHRGTVARFSFDQHDLVGHPAYERAHYDLAEVILICLGGEHKGSGALGMLEALFDASFGADEKIRRLRDDYGMIVSERFEGKVAEMCNLSEGVYEKGIEKGRLDERLEVMRSIMRASAMTLAEVLDLLGIPRAEMSRYEELLAAQPA